MLLHRFINLFKRTVIGNDHTAGPVQVSVNPQTVSVSNNAPTPQSSQACLTFTIACNDPCNVSAIGIMLPDNLYQQGTSGSISASVDPTLWDVEPGGSPGSFQVTPSAGSTNMLSPGSPFTIALESISLGNSTGTAQVSIVVYTDVMPPFKQNIPVVMQAATQQILSFTASMTSIEPGTISTLSWQCAGIDHCILSPPPNTNKLPANSHADVSPKASTSYTLDAFAEGVHLQAQLSIDVLNPQVATFYAISSMVDYNQDVSLVWTTMNTDQVQLLSNPQINLPSGNLPLNTPVNMPQLIGPITEAVTFTLKPISNNTPGSTSSPVIIDVNPPTCTFTADKTDVWEKDPVVLTWNITSAAIVTVEPAIPDGPSGKNLSGSIVLNPQASVTYTLTVTGASGTTPVTQKVQINVSPVQITTFSASPNPLTLPGPGINETTLAWAVNAQVVTLSPGIGTVNTQGSLPLNNPVDGTVYTLSAGTTANPSLHTQQLTISNYLGPYHFSSFAPSQNLLTAIMFPIPEGANLWNFVGPQFSGSFSITFSGVKCTNLQANQLAAIIGASGNSSDSEILVIAWPMQLSFSTRPIFEWEDPANQNGSIMITGIL